MKQSFPKDILDCMRDCMLAIFWPREQIISFFENNGCTRSDLQNVLSFKELTLNRVQIVDTTFRKLLEKDDGGLGQFRSILQSLIQWSYFDPYYFEKLKKLDKNEALRKIKHLKQLQEIRDAELKENLKRRIEKEYEIGKSRKTLDELQNQFIQLYQGKDEQGRNISSQQRGYYLESFLRDLFLLEKLQVTEPFKIMGEQIDGAIKFEGENYIIEAKWSDCVTASDSLYKFAQKVEGKMYGRGIFISVNGYSPESVSALQKGKTLRTILFDGGDLTLVVEGLWTFTNMLDRKVKAAQTMGRIYADVNNMEDKQNLAN